MSPPSPIFLFALAALACTGEIGGSTRASGSSAGGGPGSAASGGSTGVPPGTLGCQESEPPPSLTRVARLSNRQYDGSVQALLGTTTTPSSDFVSDPQFGGFDNNANELKVVDRQGRDYRRAAEALAADLVVDSVRLAAVAPCSTPDGTACGPAFVAAFGRRAFRRPLLAEEQAAYEGLYAQGGALVADGSLHARGVQVVVEAMLQSPNFLYRVELDDTPLSASASQLSSYEVAARLALALWNSGPDDALLELAAADKLADSEAVAAQAGLMLADARAKNTFEDFHAQWLSIDTYANVTHDATLFPEFVPGIGSALQEEVRRFVTGITFDRGLGLTALLTSTVDYVNADLAKLYGLQGSFGPDFVEVELDSAVRAGLLTRIGFLAKNAHSSTTAPILRGAFVLRNILCVELPTPPAGASMTTPPPFSDTIRTTRDQTTALTEPPTCAGCHHELINPMGFAFEEFDAVGKLRDADRGYPLDVTGAVTLDSGNLAFDGAVEASSAIAASSDARACYAMKALRYFYGRLDTSADQCTIEALSERMAAEDYGTQDLVADLTRASSFIYRSLETTP